MRDFDFPYAGQIRKFFHLDIIYHFGPHTNIQKKHNIKEFKTLLYTVL